MSTYPQDLSTEKSEHPAYPQEKMTRFEQAASLPGKSPSPDFLAYTHTNVNKKTKQKNKTNKTKKTKKQQRQKKRKQSKNKDK